MSKWRIAIAAYCCLLWIWSGGAEAQRYPTKVVRIVSAETGSAVDLVSRVIAQHLTASLGQSVIVENHTGVVAIDRVAKATPDGYTLLFLGNAVWTLPLMENTPYDPLKQFAPIMLATNSPLFLFENPSVPAKSVRELIAFAKSRPGQLNYAEPGAGTSGHLAAELLKNMAGIDVVRVSYKGSGSAIVALVSNEIHIMFTTAPSGMPHVATGKLRVLGVASAQPSVLAPEVPTISASGVPGYEATSLHAFWAPMGTPQAVINRLNHDTVQLLSRPEVQATLATYATETVGSSPGEMSSYIQKDVAKWRNLIKAAGVRAN